MTQYYPTNYCLYHLGLLETLTFGHEQKVHWFMSWDINNRFIYFDYVIGDGIPSFIKVVDLL